MCCCSAGAVPVNAAYVIGAVLANPDRSLCPRPGRPVNRRGDVIHARIAAGKPRVVRNVVLHRVRGVRSGIEAFAVERHGRLSGGVESLRRVVVDVDCRRKAHLEDPVLEARETASAMNASHWREIDAS